jgi:hypothetical protein
MKISQSFTRSTVKNAYAKNIRFRKTVKRKRETERERARETAQARGKQHRRRLVDFSFSRFFFSSNILSILMKRRQKRKRKKNDAYVWIFFKKHS